MKNKMILIISFLLICSVMLNSCDPIYPLGKLKVEEIPVLSVGDSTKIKIIYPDGGMIVTGWKNRNIEIISGFDIIDVSNLTITALKSGTALIRVSATTVISEEDLKLGHEERQYTVDVEIKVE